MKLPFKNFKISLKLKIAFVFLLLVIGMMTTVGYIFTIRELNLRKEQMKLRIERLANNIATIRSVETEDWDVYQTYIDNQIIVNPDIVYVAIFDDKGQLKIHSLNMGWLDLESGRPLTRMEQSHIVLRLDQRQVAEESQQDFETKSVNILVGNKNQGTVNIGFSLVELNDEMKRNLYRNLQLDVIFIILAVVIAFVVGSRIVNPLDKLTTAMKKISQGDLQQELHISSHDEIGEMATTFNYMARGLQEKQIIQNFSRELGFTIELEKIAHLITQQITPALNAKHGLLFLRSRDRKNQFELVSSYPAEHRSKFVLRLDKQVAHQLLTERYPRPLKSLSDHAEFLDQFKMETDFKEDALISPIVIKDEVRGIFLICCSQQGIAYSGDEIQFLNTLLSQGGFAIENALLYQELTEQERLKKEIEIASRVQLSLLPQTNPQISGLDIDGICIPAAEIGGDYYDYFRINEHTIGIAIADVTGKGTSAAFYMAVIKGIMLSLTAIYTSPKALLSELNRRVFGTMERRIFTTMIYATIDTRKHLLTFARAGHNGLIRRHAKNSHVECLTPKGIGLGLAHDKLFDLHISEQKIKFQAGDILIFYTDGISEAMNDKLEEFSEQKLMELISRLDSSSANDISEKIIREVKNFVQNAPQHDDITLVTVTATQAGN